MTLEQHGRGRSGRRNRKTAFVQALQQFGWTDGRNGRMEETRLGADAGNTRRYVAELVALADMMSWPPELCGGALQQTTRTCRSYWFIMTRSVPASSRAWHDRAATSD